MILERFSDLRFVTNEKKLKTGMTVSRERRTCNHDARAFISAHRINRDSRPHSHRLFPLFARQKPED